MTRQAWCAGCDTLHPVKEMGFTDDSWHYRCQSCREPEKVLDPPEPRRPIQFPLPRPKPVELMFLVALACLYFGIQACLDTINDDRHAQQQLHDKQREVADFRVPSPEPTLGVPMPYPAVGATVVDGPRETNGAHYHCEQVDPTYMQVGISIGGSFQSCSWRYPDNSVAPPPPHPGAGIDPKDLSTP